MTNIESNNKIQRMIPVVLFGAVWLSNLGWATVTAHCAVLSGYTWMVHLAVSVILTVWR